MLLLTYLSTTAVQLAQYQQRVNAHQHSCIPINPNIKILQWHVRHLRSRKFVVLVQIFLLHV